MPWSRRTKLALGTSLLGIALVAVVLASRETAPDRLEEARAFLETYTPKYRSGTLPHVLGTMESISLERLAYLRDEDERMVRALPTARGWTFSRTTGHFPYDVTASAIITSPTNILVRRFPFLARIFPTEMRSISIELTGFKETHGTTDSAAVTRTGQGWTRAFVHVQNASLEIDAPVVLRERLELTPTPSAPGRKAGK